MENKPGKISGRYRATLLAGIFLAFCLALASIKMGAVPIPWQDFLQLEKTQTLIIWDLRLPRAALAFLVGAILALTGVCLQGLLRNPLASPSLLGMTSGAALFAAIAILAQHSFLAFLNPAWAESIVALAAFVGCLLTSFWLYTLASASGQANTALLLLAGVALTSLAGAGIGFITFLADDAQLRSITFWNMGSVGTATWSQVIWVAVFSLPAFLILPWMGRALNAMLLGEQEAQFLGFPVERQKRIILVCVSLAIGASVAFTGVIGFVGLVIPHLLRLWLGADHQRLLPSSLVFGGCLLLASDIIARTLAAPLELPLGVVTAAIGAPYFLYLLQRSAKKDDLMIRWNNVSYAKNSRDLLQDINLQLPAGKLTVILGPNGAGKSTFLRLCSKELQPTSGSIELHDRNLQTWSPQEMALFRGVLSQSHPIAFPMEVSELVMMGRYPHKKRSPMNEKDQRIVEAALAECSVKHLEQRSTQFLSGGELQRVQTARVLAQIWDDGQQHPRVLLLDEPTASLDPAYQHQCLLTAKNLAKRGVCVIAILHDLNLAARYADNIVFLKEGRLAGAGTMREMMRESKLREVFSVDIHCVDDPRFDHPLIVTLGAQLQNSNNEPKLRSI